jgi:hypothetical protein
MSTEITSPPWPTDSAKADTMFDVLKDLHRWAGEYRDVVNTGSDHAAIQPLRAVPRKAVHDSLPIAYHYANFVGVRRIRELWDALVREYEDSWDSAAAFARRRWLVGLCVDFLNNAWLSQEVREAKQATAQEAFLRQSVARSFGFLIGPMPGVGIDDNPYPGT